MASTKSMTRTWTLGTFVGKGPPALSKNVLQKKRFFDVTLLIALINKKHLKSPSLAVAHGSRRPRRRQRIVIVLLGPMPPISQTLTSMLREEHLQSSPQPNANNLFVSDGTATIGCKNNAWSRYHAPWALVPYQRKHHVITPRCVAGRRAAATPAKAATLSAHALKAERLDRRGSQ